MTTQTTQQSVVACYHCGLPVDPTARYVVSIDGCEQSVCCPACQAVAQTINAGGFGNYYRFRTEASTQPTQPLAYVQYDQPEFQQHWLTALGNDKVECEWLIEGMHCAACVWLLENYLRRVPGVDAVQVNFATQTAFLRWDMTQQKPSDVCRAIAGIGYRPQPYSRDRAEQLRQREQRMALRRLGVAGLGMMQIGMCALGLYAGAIDGIEIVYRDFLRWVSLIVCIPMVFYSGQPFFSGAWRGLKLRQPGMDVPVALAIALAFAASVWATLRGDGEVYFDSVSMFIFLLLGSRYLEQRALHYNGRLSTDLLSLLPSAATRLDNLGRTQRVPLEALVIGDTLLVGDGEAIPADGDLLDAHASVNEAALTGEFMPVQKQYGDMLLAGSINGAQPLTMTIGKLAQHSRMATIHALSRRALLQKPRITQLADRIASHFVVAILGLAALTYAVWLWVEPARAFWVVLSVLVVSCPCALSLATPAVIANATQALRRFGLLVTRADAWEKLGSITDVVFDKTGTLTEGRMCVTAVAPCRARNATIDLDIAAALEVGSNHPLAQAFDKRNITPALAPEYYVGAGVEGTIAGRRYRLGNAQFALQLCGAEGDPHGAEMQPPSTGGQWILLADSQAPLCWFCIGDELRANTPAVIHALRRRGLTLHILSGDNSNAAHTLAAQLKIGNVVASATPEQKLDYIKTLQRDGRRVLMVGDGINDIPVLAAADVSIAMTAASQLAKTNADCILLSPQLDRLPLLFACARKVKRVMQENLAWALGYNAIAIPLAALGWVPPWLAAVGMSLSSLLVVGNALRLRYFDAD
jgi:Cu2+-exporting ATPase